MATRLEAAKAYVEAMRTGSHDAAKAAAPHIAPDAVLTIGPRKFEGHDAVLARITGVWPNTPVFVRGDWSAITQDGDKVRVHAKMRPVGAGPSAVNLTMSFNGQNQIAAVEQELVPGAQLVETNKLPDFVKRRVDNALANDTPMSVAYVNESGQPVLSLRGSTLVWGDDQLAIWARSAGGGMAKAIAKNPRVALLYRDSGERTTLTFQGRARIEGDPAIRRRLFDMTPEVERLHESWEDGVAVIIDLERAAGGTPDGRINISWNRD